MTRAIFLILALSLSMTLKNDARAGEMRGTLTSVVLHARVEGGVMLWRARFDLGAYGDLPVTVPLEKSLPAGTEVAQTSGSDIYPVHDQNDRIEAFVISGRTASGAITIRQKLQPQPESYTRLEPPLPAAGVPAKIVIDFDDYVFEPDPRLGLEHYLGYWASNTVRDEARELLDQRDDLSSHRLHGQTIYFGSTADLHALGGLPGKLQPAPHRTFQAAISIGAIFLLAVAGLVLAYRRASKEADRQRVESLLEARFAELPDP